jgi:hypothetical protein
MSFIVAACVLMVALLGDVALQGTDVRVGQKRRRGIPSFDPR